MRKKHNKVSISSNISWTMQKGSWLFQIIITWVISLFFTKIFGRDKGLQLALIFYNVCSFLFFHWIVGDPFNSEYKDFTFWEQMSVQLENSSSLTFLSLYPVFLFFAVHRIVVVWEKHLFIIAFITLMFVVVPKLGFMHMKRVFGIKRYD